MRGFSLRANGRPTSKLRRTRRGTVLIIVLGVLTILSVMGTAFARFMHTELQSSRFYALKHSAEQLARDGITAGTGVVANIASGRHYTSLKGATWAYEADPIAGNYLFTPGVPPKGFGYSSLEDSEAPSLEMPQGVGPGQYPLPEISNVSGCREGSKSTLTPYGDIYRLKIIECQSQINVRSLAMMGRYAFTECLTQLGFQISVRANVNPLDNNHGIPAALFARVDPDGNGVADLEFTSKEMFLDALRAAINFARGNGFQGDADCWKYVEDFVTVYSYPFGGFPADKANQAFEVRSDAPDYFEVRDGVVGNANFPGIKEQYNLEARQMAPLNVNTASREALIAWLYRLQGEREYMDVNRMEWTADAITGKLRMNTTGGGLDRSEDDGQSAQGFKNNSILKFVTVGGWDASNAGTPTPHTVDVLVDLIIREREKRPFTSFNDFDMRLISRLDTPANGGFTDTYQGLPIGLAALPDPAAPLITDYLGTIRLADANRVVYPECFTPDFATWYWEGCRDLMRAALNPTPRVTKYNTDEAYHTSVDVIDVTNRCGPFCFHSYGVYEITSLGQIHGVRFDPVTAQYVLGPVAQARARAVVRTMDVLRHHTQRDFMTGFSATKNVAPSVAIPALGTLTTNGTVTFPNSVNENRLYGMFAFPTNIRRGSIAQPNQEYGYVQLRPADNTPYWSVYFNDVRETSRRWGKGQNLNSQRHTTFIQRFTATLGLDTFNVNTTELDYISEGTSRRETISNQQGADESTLDGVKAHTSHMVDGVLMRGRKRHDYRTRFGVGNNIWGAADLRYPCANANANGSINNGQAPAQSADYLNNQRTYQEETNCPYYMGTTEFWIKFQDDWYGQTNAKRDSPNRDVPRSALHADSYFCGLFGATQFIQRDNNNTEGVQMYVFKDVGQQLRIVRLYFGEAFSGAVNNVNANRMGNITNMLAHSDTFKRDDLGNPDDPNDLGVLYARIDAVIHLNRLPFPILPKHWYHFSIAWDSNAPFDANDPEWPFVVCINGYRCRYNPIMPNDPNSEMTIATATLNGATNDEHEIQPAANGNPARLAKAAVPLNELNPQDRITIGCIDRWMISKAARGGRPARLFAFAEFGANEPDMPFPLIATANATIDDVHISTFKVTYQANANDVRNHARYIQDPMNPNAAMATYPNDGAGYYYENGFENPYSQPVQVAWVSWTEYRPKNDPTRPLGNVVFNADPMQYARPTRNVTDQRSDFVQIFAGKTANRAAAWGGVTDKVNSENYRPTQALPYEKFNVLGGNTPMRTDSANPIDDNLTWYGGMKWDNLMLNANDVLMYRAYFRRGEAFIANNSPQNTTPILDDIQVGIMIAPRYVEYIMLD